MENARAIDYELLPLIGEQKYAHLKQASVLSIEGCEPGRESGKAAAPIIDSGRKDTYVSARLTRTVARLMHGDWSPSIEGQLQLLEDAIVNCLQDENNIKRIAHKLVKVYVNTNLYDVQKKVKELAPSRL